MVFEKHGVSYVVLFFLIAALIASGFYAYQFYISQSIMNGVSAPDYVKQFYTNLRFNHNNLSYYVHYDCSDEKKFNFEKAISILEGEVGTINFKETLFEQNADILVACSPDIYETERNVFIAGEGGPTRFLNFSMYPVILQGKVILYNESLCDYPVTELHEILHVFGFEHINDSSKIMYPYINCKQRIHPDAMDIMKQLYSVEPLPELHLSEVKAERFGDLLNFSIKVTNEGLVDSKRAVLSVYDQDRILKSFVLGNIAIGITKTFEVSNLNLRQNSNRIKFIVDSEENELDNSNNAAELEI